MKSKYVLIVSAVVAVLLISLVTAVSVNSQPTASSSEKQCVSTNICPFAQPASDELSDGGCQKSKKKCDPNCTNDCCKKKSDPNCTK